MKNHLMIAIRLTCGYVLYFDNTILSAHADTYEHDPNVDQSYRLTMDLLRVPVLCILQYFS